MAGFIDFRPRFFVRFYLCLPNPSLETLLLKLWNFLLKNFKLLFRYLSNKEEERGGSRALIAHFF